MTTVRVRPDGDRWKILVSGRSLMGAGGKPQYFETKKTAVSRAKRIAKSSKPSKLVIEALNGKGRKHEYK